MKYTALNELNHFAFHDAHIHEIVMQDRGIKLLVSALNATTKNSQNSFDKDMCIDQAEVVFEDAKIESIVFGAYTVSDSNHIITSYAVQEVKAEEYENILANTPSNFCDILSEDELSDTVDKKHQVCFNVDCKLGDYDIVISFSNAVVRWDKYCGIAWYEDEKWKRNNVP